jgi:hypothetical protein
MFLKSNKEQFTNIVTGDETWVHYFEAEKPPTGNKLWLTEHGIGRVVSRRTIYTKKVLYYVLFSYKIAKLTMCET